MVFPNLLPGDWPQGDAGSELHPTVDYGCYRGYTPGSKVPPGFRVATTSILLSTGDRIDVDGSPQDVAKALENAARSSHGTLAWLTDTVTGEQLGVSAAQVVSVAEGSA